jgi:hypothetical protein
VISARPPRGSRRRKRRLPVVLRWVVRIAIVVVVFGIGVAVGQALEDRPQPEEPVTNITTIRPWTQTTQP